MLPVSSIFITSSYVVMSKGILITTNSSTGHFHLRRWFIHFRLMTLEHACRLGSVHGATAISRHPFFNGINWEGVEHKNLRPPFR